jgi:hypothetical protein
VSCTRSASAAARRPLPRYFRSDEHGVMSRTSCSSRSIGSALLLRATSSNAWRCSAEVPPLTVRSAWIAGRPRCRSRIAQSFVALVHGQSGDRTSRERIFAGFNTPLLPEILICTSVGAEGIDLHRHCRRVVHYDLAWNPALVEQRTGRIDRIGSKTFRERERVQSGLKPWLEVGIPFLAGTYDERMFDELRMRAQTFEVLTGGDLAASNPEEDQLDAEGREANLNLHPLPPEMLEDLRAQLHVWSEV